MPETIRIPVRVQGTVRGVVIDADGSVRLADNVVSVAIDDREHALRIDRMDGVVWEPPRLTIHIARDRIALSGHAALQPLGSQIVTSALALPELTRTMHSLGSRRGRPGADHDRFFGSLLAARRAAEGFVEVESRLVAFDSQRLAHSLTTALGELAAERYPNSPPDRRALEAELLEHAERLVETLTSLGDAAARVRESGSEARLARWREWTWAVQRVFEEADRCWVASIPALTAAGPASPRRRFWRRAYGLVAISASAIHGALVSGAAT
ncbi:MAG TPA: hypothetical protein VFZ21_28795 [Gemmatimonadaceae bacterium]|jgi:hypothetical protein|nr:hypothetical protein [Gemmatimonadaceae bacterium]